MIEPALFGMLISGFAFVLIFVIGVSWLVKLRADGWRLWEMWMIVPFGLLVSGCLFLMGYYRWTD